MTPARFRLQSVLSYKEKLVNLLQIELGALERARQREEARLADLKQERRARLEGIAAEQADGLLDLERLTAAYAFIARLDQELEVQRLAVEAAARRVEEKRVQLAQKHQETKVLDKLKERHAAARRRELQSLEAKVMDEIAAVKASRDHAQLEGVR